MREYGVAHLYIIIDRKTPIDTTYNPYRKQINQVNTNIYIKSNESYEY